MSMNFKRLPIVENELKQNNLTRDATIASTTRALELTQKAKLAEIEKKLKLQY